MNDNRLYRSVMDSEPTKAYVVLTISQFRSATFGSEKIGYIIFEGDYLEALELAFPDELVFSRAAYLALPIYGQVRRGN